MQSLRFIGHKSATATDNSINNIMDSSINNSQHRNNLSMATTATSLGAHHSSSNNPVTTTQQQYPQGSSVMGHNTNTFADNSNRGTTGPIAINPILANTDGSPTRSDHTHNGQVMSPTSSNSIRLLADSSSAALMNVINNSSSSMLLNSSLVSNESSNSGNVTNMAPMSNSEYESKLLINSLYRKGSRRRRLIQNPWDQLESMGLMSTTTNMESINPRYASRPEMCILSSNPGHYTSRHLRSSSGSSSSNNGLNSDNHVYECIDADSIHNYNINHQYQPYGHR